MPSNGHPLWRAQGRAEASSRPWWFSPQLQGRRRPLERSSVDTVPCSVVALPPAVGASTGILPADVLQPVKPHHHHTLVSVHRWCNHRRHARPYSVLDTTAIRARTGNPPSAGRPVASWRGGKRRRRGRFSLAARSQIIPAMQFPHPTPGPCTELCDKSITYLRARGTGAASREHVRRRPMRFHALACPSQAPLPNGEDPFCCLPRSDAPWAFPIQDTPPLNRNPDRTFKDARSGTRLWRRRYWLCIVKLQMGIHAR